MVFKVTFAVLSLPIQICENSLEVSNKIQAFFEEFFYKIIEYLCPSNRNIEDITVSKIEENTVLDCFGKFMECVERSFNNPYVRLNFPNNENRVIENSDSLEEEKLTAERQELLQLRQQIEEAKTNLMTSQIILIRQLEKAIEKNEELTQRKGIIEQREQKLNELGGISTNPAKNGTQNESSINTESSTTSKNRVNGQIQEKKQEEESGYSEYNDKSILGGDVSLKDKYEYSTMLEKTSPGKVELIKELNLQIFDLLRERGLLNVLFGVKRNESQSPQVNFESIAGQCISVIEFIINLSIGGNYKNLIRYKSIINDSFQNILGKEIDTVFDQIQNFLNGNEIIVNDVNHIDYDSQKLQEAFSRLKLDEKKYSYDFFIRLVKVIYLQS